MFNRGHCYIVCMGFLLCLGCMRAIGTKCLIILNNLVVVQCLAIWSPIFETPWMITVSLIMNFEVRNIPGAINEIMRDCLAWCQLFSNSKVIIVPFWRSDHRPVLLEIQESVSALAGGGEGSRHRFHYKQCWAEDKGYRNRANHHKICKKKKELHGLTSNINPQAWAHIL
ncbi:hypothetical protein ACOSP7_029443 [Xanthoceras sorbifolium]